MNDLSVHLPVYGSNKRFAWSAVLDSCVSCPNCDESMQTMVIFHPVKGKVAGLKRSQLQTKGPAYWLDKCDEAYDVCPNCGYKDSGRY